MAHHVKINLVSLNGITITVFLVTLYIGQFYVHNKPTAGKPPQGAVRFQSAQNPDYSLYWEDTDVYLKVK